MIAIAALADSQFSGHTGTAHKSKKEEDTGRKFSGI